MHDSNEQPFTFPTATEQPSVDDPLTTILRQGARRLLAQAVQAEVDGWIDDHAHLTDQRGHRQVVRNGYAQSRQVVTGLGPVEVQSERPSFLAPLRRLFGRSSSVATDPSNTRCPEP